MPICLCKEKMKILMRNDTVQVDFSDDCYKTIPIKTFNFHRNIMNTFDSILYGSYNMIS